MGEGIEGPYKHMIGSRCRRKIVIDWSFYNKFKSSGNRFLLCFFVNVSFLRGPDKYCVFRCA